MDTRGWAFRKLLEHYRRDPPDVSVKEHSATTGIQEARIWKLSYLNCLSAPKKLEQGPGEVTDTHAPASRNLSAGREQTKGAGG